MAENQCYGLKLWRRHPLISKEEEQAMAAEQRGDESDLFEPWGKRGASTPFYKLAKESCPLITEIMVGNLDNR